IAQLDQAGLGLPDRDYYLKNDGNVGQVRAAYAGHVGRYFALLGKKPAEVRAATDDVMRIETALARLQQDKVTRRDPHAIYHRIDRAGLTKVAAAFPWAEYFGALDLGGVTAITVNDPKYYAGVVKLLGAEKPAALRHYLTATLLHGVGEILPKAYEEEAFFMRRTLFGVKELPPRWRRCVLRVDDDVGELLGQSYVAARFAGDSKPRAVDLTKAVLAAMSTEIDRLPWMDAPTRAAAHTKLAKMAYLVGYPDKWREYTFDVGR